MAKAISIEVTPKVRECLQLAEHQRKQGRVDLAVELTAGAATVDIRQDRCKFLQTAEAAAWLCEHLVDLYRGLGAEPLEIPRQPSAGRPLKIAYMIFSLAMGQAASRRLSRLVALHDRECFTPTVICAEELTCRKPPQQFIRMPDAPSSRIGAPLIEQMRADDCPTIVLPIEGSFPGVVHGTLEQLRKMAFDVVIFIASPACAVQAGLAYHRIAPLQLNQNIGVPMLIPGIDAVLYHHAETAKTDQQFLEQAGYRQLSLPTLGTDMQLARQTAAEPRAALGLPGDAVAMVTASNNLPGRIIAGSFIEDLSKVMHRHPHTWYVMLGQGNFTDVMQRFEKQGVAERVIHVGQRDAVQSVFKACDIYLNEYPEGGANTVMEAMACQMPTVAMRCGEGHTWSIGNALLPPEDRIATFDTERYWAKAERWITDAAHRQTAGQRMYDYARQTHSYEAICRQYEQWITELYNSHPA